MTRLWSHPYLDLDGIAGATQRPRDVVGLHFFSHAHVMRLLAPTIDGSGRKVGELRLV